MIQKIKKLLLKGEKLAEYFEKNEEFYDAYKEYLNLGNHVKAGKVLEKSGMWHDAANLYIQKNEVNQARRAIEECFKKNSMWETFELDNGNTISIEDWLKQKQQVRRFVRYVKHVNTVNNKNIPIIVLLAKKLKQVLEFKSAAELFEKGFEHSNKDQKVLKNEVWLRYAAECYAREKLYPEAAECMKRLIITEVNIGESLMQSGLNPYRNYVHNLKLARQWNILPLLLEKVADFDPFNFAYDLLKIDEVDMSSDMFFKYFARVVKKEFSDEERELRNKRIQYCFNQYIIYYRNKKEYKKAAEIALLNSQKEIAGELFKKAEEEEKSTSASSLGIEELVTIEELEKKKPNSIPQKIEILKCPSCGEPVEPDWEVCPNCDTVLDLEMCVCGQKIKTHWKRCPACQRILTQPIKTQLELLKDPYVETDTKPFTFPTKLV
jgi:tetratricopeptide (TPR) repeat protein